MSWNPSVPKEIVTHAQRVCRLYKRAIRECENYALSRHEFRYDATVMRDRFEQTRAIKDMRILAVMLAEGEKELHHKQHIQPIIKKHDFDGIEHHRYHLPYDQIQDHWHPWEKAAFVDYFELREKRKEEMVAYHDASVMKKGQIDLDKSEFPLGDAPK